MPGTDIADLEQQRTGKARFHEVFPGQCTMAAYLRFDRERTTT